MATHSSLLLDTYARHAAFRKYCKRLSHQLFECLLSGKCHKSIKARTTGLFFFFIIITLNSALKSNTR